MIKKMLRRLAQLAAVFALFYLLLCGYMWNTQQQHIFEPEAIFQTTPDKDGMQYEEVIIPSGQGTERGDLYGWWIPATQADAPVFIYLHGNYRNIGYNVEHAMRLHNLGYKVLLVDYRGYGKSTGGSPSETKIYEDAEAMWNYLVQQRGIAPQRIFIYGHSLGGAIAIDLAQHHPEAAGVIAESTFTSLPALGQLKYAYLPVGWILNQRFDSLHKIGQLKIPILLIHGTWDQKVPYQMSQQLFDQAPSPKYLTLIAGGEHSNNSGIAWLEYRDALNTFVGKHSH